MAKELLRYWFQSLNVTAGDSRDESGKARFFALPPEDIIVPGSKDPEFWYWKNQFYPADVGAQIQPLHFTMSAPNRCTS